MPLAVGVQYWLLASSTLKRNAAATGTIGPSTSKANPFNAEASNGIGVMTPMPVAGSIG